MYVTETTHEIRHVIFDVWLSIVSVVRVDSPPAIYMLYADYKKVWIISAYSNTPFQSGRYVPKALHAFNVSPLCING